MVEHSSEDLSAVELKHSRMRLVDNSWIMIVISKVSIFDGLLTHIGFQKSHSCVSQSSVANCE